jgi:hypothetical protein
MLESREFLLRARLDAATLKAWVELVSPARG